MYKARKIVKQRGMDLARLCHDALATRATTHGRVCRHNHASRLLAAHGAYLGCTAVQPCRTAASFVVFF